MEQKKEIDLVALFKAVRAKRKMVLRWALIGLVFGVVVALSIPKEYAVNVKIVSENSTKNSSAMSSMGGFAAMMGVNLPSGGVSGIGEDVYPELMRSTPFLGEFAQIEVPFKGQNITLQEYLNKHQKSAWWNYVLGAPSMAMGWVGSLFRGTSDAVAPEVTYTALDPSPEQRSFEAGLVGRISVARDKKTGVFDLRTTMQDPRIAAIVADSLTVKLKRYMTHYYTSKAAENLAFNIQQLEQARQRYYTADSLYAAAVDRNQNLVTRSAQLKLDRLQNERNLANSLYQQLASQVEVNRIKLQTDIPIATVIEPARVPSAPVSPKRGSIIVGFAFLAAFFAALLIVIKKITQRA